MVSFISFQEPYYRDGKIFTINPFLTSISKQVSTSTKFMVYSMLINLVMINILKMMIVTVMLILVTVKHLNTFYQKSLYDWQNSINPLSKVKNILLSIKKNISLEIELGVLIKKNISLEIELGVLNLMVSESYILTEKVVINLLNICNNEYIKDK